MNYFSLDSSSLHVINSDNKLNFIEKYCYLLFNVINNLLQIGAKNSFSLHYPKYTNYSEMVIRAKASGRISPARFFCNEFWGDLNLNTIKNALGDEIKAIEIGCGSGIYGKKLITKDQKLQYTGVDIVTPAKWEPEIKDRATFVQGSCDDIGRLLMDNNLLFTQSALEHFEKDLRFMKEIGTAVKKTGKPLIQIHLFPSGPCLKTFLWHGIRQYNLRLVKKLIKQSTHSAKPILICLGGKNSNSFHWKSITKPSILRNLEGMYKAEPTYGSALVEAIKLDAQSNKPKSASFNILITQHNLSKELDFNAILGDYSEISI
jgi:hypothetical protein